MNDRKNMRTALFIACVAGYMMNASCQFARSAPFSSEDEKQFRLSTTFSSPAYNKASQEDLAAILPEYPKKVKQIASSLGLLAELRQMAELKNKTAEGQGNERPLLLLHHQFLSHVTLIMLEGNSAVAAARCEKAPVEEVVDHLQRVEDHQTGLFTIISVITGSIGDVLSGVFSLGAFPIASAVSNISGGGLATTSGSSAFFRDTDYELEHSRNILKEIWEGPSESTIFPPSVWSFLTSPGPDQQAPREILIKKWRSKAGISEKGSEEEEARASLMFGEGGVYELGDLRARGAMLDLLASTIELMNQEIEILMREILQRQSFASPDAI